MIVPPLTQQQVITAIQKRYELLSIEKGCFTKPVENDFIIFLYDLYNGKLRYVMDAVNMLISEISTPYATTIPTQTAKIVLSSLVTEQIQLKLTLGELNIFLYCVSQDCFTNGHISKEFKIATSNTARIINKFRELNLIYMYDKVGKKSYYKVCEYTKVIKGNYKQVENDKKPTNYSQPKVSFQKQRMLKAISIIEKFGEIRHKQYIHELKVSPATASRDLKQLVKIEKLERLKDGKTVYYKIKK